MIRPPRDERLARMAWARLTEPDDARVSRWIEELGAVEALSAVVCRALPDAERYAQRWGSFDLDADQRHAERIGATVLMPSDPQWPLGVNLLRCPPHALWVRGETDLAGLLTRSVAVVGARAATVYGLDCAADLAAGLAERGFTIASGAAYGIDAAAHRGALSVPAATIAVLAGGVDRPYPIAHADLLDEIITSGSVVSESPLACSPTRSRFLTRNRLLATMTQGTLVVEAGLRSGSLNTATWAAKHHRPVGAIPGPVTSMVSAGCHAAVRSGKAMLVTDAAEAADLFGGFGTDTCDAPRGVDSELDMLSPEVRVIYDALPVRAPVCVADLCRRALKHEGEVRGALARLDLLGHAQVNEAGLWRRALKPR